MRRITPAMVGALAMSILTRQAPLGLSRGYQNFRDNVIKRWNRKATGSGPLYPASRNSGQRRKNAIAARRMNNAGHGNRWSRKHA